MIQLIRSKRRTISLMVKDDGGLLVRAPHRTRIEYVEKFVQEKQSWIKKQRILMQDFLQRRKSHKFITDEGILYLGKRRRPRGLDLGRYEAIKSWYKEQAFDFLQERLDFYSKELNLKYGVLKITNAKRRWGSCSGLNNMNFTWRLMMAPKKVIDYVAVHELAHIKHKNHSPRFWNLVAEMMPKYKKYDDWLEENRFLLEF